MDEPSFARTVPVNCNDDTVLAGTSPLTVQARDQFGAAVVGFTASVFNSCGRIRVARDGVDGDPADGSVTFQFAAGASVFVLAQGGVTVAAASLDFAPPTGEPSELAKLAFGGAPLNTARMTVAGQGNTILSLVPTLSRLETAVSSPPVSVKNSGTTVLMTLPRPTDTDSDGWLEGVRQIRPFNLAAKAALPIVAVQVLESPPTLRGCGLFTSTDEEFCLSGEGVGVIRGLDLMDPASEDFATLATAELDGVPCVIEVLGNPGGGQGLLTASVPCDESTGIDQNRDGIEEIFLFARPAFCDLDVTVEQADAIGDANVLDFLRLEAGVVTDDEYPYPGTRPSETAIAVIGEALLLSAEPVTMTLKVKETGTATGSSVRDINVQLTPVGESPGTSPGTSFVLVDCVSDSARSPAFCVSDPRGLAGHSGTLVLWNILVTDLTAGSTREVSINVKGKDAVPDADRSGGEARLTVPGVIVPTGEFCPVENGGGRFSPIGG
ncbi:MAG TPA: hypothetical protein VMM12_07550 [Longimicrobiales bacterium]|nr:hypothetical protein [Longimicrobiales bacterium]